MNQVKSVYSCIFVTVGTTEFDDLIRTIDSDSFVRYLQEVRCCRLIIQYGRGTYEPSHLKDMCEQNKISCDAYRFKPTLDQDMRQADLIISHCGAGSILEAVKYKKELLVVVNESLQDNHQTELADAMSEMGYCMSTTPGSLLAALYTTQNKQQSSCSAESIPINDASIFSKVVEDLFDFSS